MTALATGALLATIGLAASQSADASSHTAKVMVTTQRMSDARLTSTQKGTYAKNSRVTLTCYKRGQSVKGYFSGSFSGGWDNLWYKVSDGYFIADVDIDTGSNSPVTGACSAPPTSNATVDTNAWYTFTLRGSKLLLDVRGGATKNGTPVQQYKANSTKSQKFRLTSNGDGTYRVYSALSSTQVLDASLSSNKAQTWSWGGGKNQRWLVRKSKTSGNVTLSPLSATSKCLDVTGGSTKASVQLQVYACNGSTAQDFAMKSAGVVNPVAGKCNAFTGAKTLGTYTISGIKLPVCGPRPDFDKPAHYNPVRPYPGAPTTNPGYQCAELSARWLWYRYKVASVRANGAQIVDNYAKAYATKFTKISNGTKNKAPRAGDVLSLSAKSNFSDYGHTGVVISSSVNAKGNGIVTTAEENWGGTGGTAGKHVYSVKAWKVQYAALPYIKWLRAK